NVTVGRDISTDELLEHYHQVVYSTGSSTDRRLGVSGEDLLGSHPATEFVGWYNGHPDFTDRVFDLSAETAVVVGVGNVAMDVARVLLRDPEELAATDIPAYALESLRASRVREVVILGRRGPAQAAFDQREIQNIAELRGVEVVVEAEQIESALKDAQSLDNISRRKVEHLATLIGQHKSDATRRVRLEFLASPVEVLGESGRMRAVRIERNQLHKDERGGLSARGTGEIFTLHAGLIFRSIGYHGVALPGLPFDDRRGVVPNQEGRVTNGFGGSRVPRVYVTGWIKRGPTGVIGTNKPDALETVRHMLEDARGEIASPAEPSARAVDSLLSGRRVRVTNFDEWRKLDTLERARGHRSGQVRCKFTSLEEMLSALKP
ncbi:MAG TPA: NADP oxidoreductase, partial [Polyangiaceae bacterium]